MSCHVLEICLQWIKGVCFDLTKGLQNEALLGMSLLKFSSSDAQEIELC